MSGYSHDAARLRGSRSARFAWVLVIVVAFVVASCGEGEIDVDASPTTASNVGASTTEATPAGSSATQSTTSTAFPTTTVGATTTTAAVTVATPMETATAWITAFEAGDVAGFQELMHPDATANCLQCGYDRQETAYFGQVGEGTVDVSDSRLLALGDGSLNAVCTADGRVVTCATLRSTKFGHFTADGEPTRQWNATYEFIVEDGLITRRIITNNGGTAYDSGRVAAYETWLRETHPDVHAEIFAFGTILLTTVEQFAQHQEHVAEYWAGR